MASTVSISAKFLVVLALLIGGVFVGLRFLRPVVSVGSAWVDTAVRAIPGTVTVRAKQETQLKSDVGGRVAETFLEIGRKVSEGEVLVVINTDDIEIEINRLRNELDALRRKIEVGSQTRYTLIDAQLNLEESERLLKRGSLPAVEFEKKKRAVQQIEDRIALEELQNQQQLDSMENNLMVRERQKEKMTILAPIDCIIADVVAFRGDLIGAGAPIAQIISPVKVVEARISQEDMRGLTLGQKASVCFLGYGDELYKAEVVKILPVADADTQRYIVHLSVEVDPDLLVPGITGEVSIVIDQRENAIVVPRRAVIGNEIYIVKDGVIEVRTITRGFIGLNKIEILEGVSEGERVVTSNYDHLRSGDRIRILED
jgi:RND family efflux transporter MFP subunit